MSDTFATHVIRIIFLVVWVLTSSSIIYLLLVPYSSVLLVLLAVVNVLSLLLVVLFFIQLKAEIAIAKLKNEILRSKNTTLAR